MGAGGLEKSHGRGGTWAVEADEQNSLTEAFYFVVQHKLPRVTVDFCISPLLTSTFPEGRGTVSFKPLFLSNEFLADFAL